MKIFYFFLIWLLTPWVLAYGQTYEPVAVSGFNHDVVAEGTGGSTLSTTTKEMDATPISNNVFCTKEFAAANNFQPAGIYGLPDNGLFQSATRTYQMAPFDENNALYLLTTESGDLVLDTPARFTNLSLFGLSTENGSTITITFQFSDGTNQVETQLLPDWFDASTSPFAGYGRVKRIDGPFIQGTHYESAANGRPIINFFDFTLPCTKILERISIRNTTNNIPSGSSNRAFVFAVSGAKVNTTPQINVTATKTTICAGEQVDFSSSILDGGTTPVYTWNINGIPVPQSNSPNFGSATLNNGDKVTCTLVSNAFCAFPQTVTSAPVIITVNALRSPTINVTSSNTDVCQGTPIQFEATSTNGGTAPKYLWFKNGFLASSSAPEFTLDEPTDGDLVYCQIISNDICLITENATSTEFEAKVTQAYVVSIQTVDSLEIKSPILTLQASPPGGTWSGPGVSAAQFNPAVAGVGWHWVQYGFPGNRCSAPDSIRIRVFEEILPCAWDPMTLLTPNGDEKNDRWNIGIWNKVCVENADVEVFDRWGKSVFSAARYDNSWEGKGLTDGVYFFRIQYRLVGNAQEQLKTGVLLIQK